MKVISKITSLGMVLSATFLNPKALLVVVLGLSVFLSAVSVVYVGNWHHRLFINIQQAQLESDTLHSRWTQLLLEHSTYAAHPRVAEIAQKKLQMTVPISKKVRMLEL